MALNDTSLYRWYSDVYDIRQSIGRKKLPHLVQLGINPGHNRLVIPQLSVRIIDIILFSLCPHYTY